MRTLFGISPRSAGVVAGAALAVAGIVLCVGWIPASSGSPVVVSVAFVAPAAVASRLVQVGDTDAVHAGRDLYADLDKPAAAMTAGILNAEAADLAIFLDWHMNASSGYASVLDGLSCVPHAAKAAPQPVQSGKRL
jgi:hypothetical protein